MVIFGVVVHAVVTRSVHLGGDVPCGDPRRLERGAVHLRALLRLLELRLGGAVDAAAVLGSRVVALPHALRGIVAGPVHGEEVGEGDDGGIPRHLDRLGVTGLAAAHFFVRRVLGVPRAVTHGG